MIKNIILLTVSIIILVSTTNLMIFKKPMAIMIEWKIMSMKSSDMSMFLMMDEKSLSFILVVLLVTTSILISSQFYMEKKKMMFYKILIMFMISMLMLILSPNMISLVMSWEGLGMTSFVLIMYYQNKKSMMSSMYTMMMNRVGDMTLLMSVMMLMNLNSWMMVSTEFLNSDLLWIDLIVISMFSKSAQIPFSSWLTEAMAAPTPVSALVHSSTLVTAGVYLMIRFKSTMSNLSMDQIILAVAMMTLMMASMNSLMEMDMKKLVALSTLSQISVMFISISVNLHSLAFFHMIMHATFKALIFLCSSTFISHSNTQDLRKMSSTSMNLMLTKICFNMASMILCALPFLSSFYSKEIIVETIMLTKMNKIVGSVFIMLMMVTTIYSLKMMVMINLNKMSMIMKLTSETNNQKLSKIFLIIPSVFMGNKLSWSMELNKDIIYLSISEKLTPMIMTLLLLMMIKINQSPKMTKSNNSVKQMITYMLFMKNLNLYKKIKFMNQMFMLTKMMEKGMVMNQTALLLKVIYTSASFIFKLNQIGLKPMMITMIISMILFL
uniref:NADH:ubiquinone reductase (H(+)-translocating) n=1 Tax=Bemisia tabaci TaxID=7038 RepID=A0A678NM19_BEMTA|nr:NADH dehydrogenase subunit 5 [Bemisia tabaci]